MIYPLDLQTILVNTFAGNTLLFAFIAVMFIASMAAYFRMPNLITLVMIGMFVLMFAPFFEGMWVLVIFIVAITTYYGIKGLVAK